MLSPFNRFVRLLLALALGAGRALCAEAGQTIRFNRDIRPIFAENCLLCHGPDKNRRKAKLRLDVRETALDLKAIVPGKPEESLLVQHIFATNADDLMPPPDTHKALTAEEKKTLKEWITQGAPSTSRIGPTSSRCARPFPQ
jgi:mono/diheme cytochrome c family protein